MAAQSDLTDDEIEELDDLLAQTPEPLDPLDVTMLDGYLCGVIVQPELIDPALWLAKVYDINDGDLPADADPAWRARCEALIVRHHAAINASLVENGGFDPLILELEEGETAQLPEEFAGMSAISLALMPWVVGFQRATMLFPALLDSADDAVMPVLARLYRHLPPEDDEERAIFETLEREQPLTNFDDAVEDLVQAVAEIADLTQDDRYRVETVRRDAPKVGRNDACPCGSGKKYKHCHGAT